MLVRLVTSRASGGPSSAASASRAQAGADVHGGGHGSQSIGGRPRSLDPGAAASLAPAGDRSGAGSSSRAGHRLDGQPVARRRRSPLMTPVATGVITDVARQASRLAGLERCSSTTGPSKAARASCNDQA